jgi:hypothetical protein
MEECLKIIREECIVQWGPFNVPSILTKDNVNDFVDSPHNRKTLFECIVVYIDNESNRKK